MGRQVLGEINSLFVGVTLIYQCIGFIEHYSKNFNKYRWLDPTRARQLLNKGKNIIDENPTVGILHPLVCSIIELLDMPAGNKPKFP